MNERTRLGRNIESVLGPSRYDLARLASEIGVGSPVLSGLLTGQVRPDLGLVKRIAEVLRVPLDLLAGGTELATGAAPRCVFTRGPEDPIRWIGYFASALTGMTGEARRRIDADAAIARRACERVHAFLYEPGWYTDPDANEDLSPAQVYEIDYEQVAQSDFMILDARQPSFGVGQELQMAAESAVAVLLLVPRGVRVSRMVRGTPARLREIGFSGDDELLRALDRELPDLVADLAAVEADRRRARVRDIPAGAARAGGFAARVKEARERTGLDERAAARLAGISPEALVRIEAGGFSNPSVLVVRRLAAVLGTSVAKLVDGPAPGP
jgi:transcriptional regulator with XRE-family HTH domain